MELSLTRAPLRRGSDTEPYDGFPPQSHTATGSRQWQQWGMSRHHGRRQRVTAVGAEPAIGSGLRRWDFCTTRMKWWINYKDIYNNVIISVSELREIHGRDTSVRRGNKRGLLQYTSRSLFELYCPTGWDYRQELGDLRLLLLFLSTN